MSDDYKQMDHAKKIQHVAANRRRHLQNPVASGPQKSGMRKNMSFANAQEYKRGKLNAARKPIRQVQSMPDFRDPLRDILRSVPFYAIHGMGSHVRKLSKTFSRHSFSGTQRGKDSLFDSQISDAIQKQGYTTRLILVVFSVLMGAINFGYNTSVLNTPEAIIRQSLTSRPWVDDFSWAIIVSIFCIGGLLGSTIAPPLLDTMGRKTFLLYNGIFLTLALLFQAVSMGVMWLAVARLLIGVSCGGSTVAVPLYLGEIAPVNLRGSLGTLNQFAMVVGILLAQILGRPLGNDPGWRILLGIGAIFSTLQVLLSVFIVESPRWLVMQGKHGKARELLKILRGEAETSELLNMEIQSMLEVSNMERREISVGTLVRNPRLRLPFMIGIALMVFQQFSGINAVFYYSTGFFTRAGFSDPYLGTVLAGTVNVVATWFAVELMDRAGRKALLVLSSVGMTVSSCVLTFAMVAGPMLQIELGYLEIFGVLLYVAFFEFGLGPIPWAITAELFGAVEVAMFRETVGGINIIIITTSIYRSLLHPNSLLLLLLQYYLPTSCCTAILSHLCDHHHHYNHPLPILRLLVVSFPESNSNGGMFMHKLGCLISSRAALSCC